MADPTTAAGRALLADLEAGAISVEFVPEHLVAIETEAAAPYREVLERLVKWGPPNSTEGTTDWEQARALLRREVGE